MHVHCCQLKPTWFERVTTLYKYDRLNGTFLRYQFVGKKLQPEIIKILLIKNYDMMFI